MQFATRSGVWIGCLFAITIAISWPANFASVPPARAAALPTEYFMGADMPYEAFDTLEITRLAVKGGELRIGFAGGGFALGKKAVTAWIERSANAVATYFGRFPVDSARVLVVPVGGGGVKRGQAFGYQGAAIRVFVGRQSNQRHFDRDWIMVHEMVHLAFPKLDLRHNWLAEGIATYVESIARVQSGDLDQEIVWRGFMVSMPKGLPRSGDKGLDFTPTWGRTYWGGAMFCLIADIEIRRQTGNRLGLQQALQAVNAETSHESHWPIRRALELANTALPQPVLIPLYERMRAKPVSPDLEKLWASLGLSRGDRHVEFDDTAPLAATRIAILKRQ